MEVGVPQPVTASPGAQADSPGGESKVQGASAAGLLAPDDGSCFLTRARHVILPPAPFRGPSQRGKIVECAFLL